MVRSAVLIGSVAPDIPFYLLTLGSFLYYQNVMGWPSNTTAQYIFRTLYFEDPLWIAGHNLLHSPVSLLFGLTVAHSLKSRWNRLSHWIHWFLMACLLHSLVDILTHHNDGRFSSPISYWDRAHFGSQMATFEWILDLSLVGYLIFHWRRSKL